MPIVQGGLRAAKGSEAVVCTECGSRYEIDHSGVAFLTDRDELRKYLSKRSKHRENWLQNDQIDAAFRGPYRHVFRHRAEFWTSKLKPFLNNQSVVLDYGCGDGSNLHILKNLSHGILLGMDYNSVRLTRASGIVSSPDAVVCGDIFRGTLASNTFDVIFCNHVLEHIHEDEEALRLFYAALKPSGLLMLGVPNEGSFICKVRDYVLQPYIRFTTDHVHFYTAQSLREKVLAGGFKIVEEKHIGFVFPFTFVDKMLKSREAVCDTLNKWIEESWESQSDALYFLCQKGPSVGLI
jgi:SAM-dependent methyltransferase